MPSPLASSGITGFLRLFKLCRVLSASPPKLIFNLDKITEHVDRTDPLLFHMVGVNLVSFHQDERT